MKPPLPARPSIAYHNAFSADSPRLRNVLAQMEKNPLSKGRSDVCIRNLLFTLAINCRPKAILEVGSHIGAAALVLGHACEINRHGKVYTLEPNPIFYNELKKNITAAGLGKFIVPIKGFSHEAKVHARLEKMEFQLIFIDARHNYNTVRFELAYFAELLAPNAFIILHDSSIMAASLDKEKLGGVRRAILEFCAKNKGIKPILFEPPLWGNAQGACLLCKQ